MHKPNIILIFVPEFKTNNKNIMASCSKFKPMLIVIRVKQIIKIMNKHNRSEVDTYEFDDTPIILDSTYYEDCFTLDHIKVIEGTNPYLVFECSSSMSNQDVRSCDISADNLVAVLDWLVENEEYVFSIEK